MSSPVTSLLLKLSHSHHSDTQYVRPVVFDLTQNGYHLRPLRHLVRPDTITLEDAATPLYIGPPVRVIRDFLSLDLTSQHSVIKAASRHIRMNHLHSHLSPHVNDGSR